MFSGPATSGMILLCLHRKPFLTPSDITLPLFLLLLRLLPLFLVMVTRIRGSWTTSKLWPDTLITRPPLQQEIVLRKSEIRELCDINRLQVCVIYIKHTPEEALRGCGSCYVRISGVVKADATEITLTVAIAHRYCVLSSLVTGSSDTINPAFLHI